MLSKSGNENLSIWVGICGYIYMYTFTFKFMLYLKNEWIKKIIIMLSQLHVKGTILLKNFLEKHEIALKTNGKGSNLLLGINFDAKEMTENGFNARSLFIIKTLRFNCTL